jgi:TRAP-type uncharacterized transport system substrate-binding protein
LAEIVSRPPGLPKCDPGKACGVPGVVADAETYDQPAALVQALIDGKVATGIVPASEIYAARCRSPKDHAPAPIWTLKSLYRQPLQILVRDRKAIATPQDFAGKTIAVGERGSDSETVALALLDAYGVPRAKVKLTRSPLPPARAALESGPAAALVLVGHASDPAIGELIGQGFSLLALPDTPQRQKLLKALAVFDADAIAPGAYPGQEPVSTISQPVVWAAGPKLDPGLAATLVAAASEPRNLARLSSLIEPLPSLPEGEAFENLPAPPVEGVERSAIARHLPLTVIGCPAASTARR